ncbi:MAG: FAD-dependent oxidoreductase [Gemmatimonadales bacterium]|nr:FAD-dependent oxidoreductase [Gemmatimonadales bacterium]MYG18305.1 FAD-dependent oxidoreductase [Gemmatimonadales bacterium]
MDRRTLIKTVGAAALGSSLGACSPAWRRLPPGPTASSLPLLRVAPDRVIRTTVGLRPFRPAGFRVAIERLDEKTVIHNYGHGGAGISLSWGTGLLVSELAEPHPSRQAAVIGAGAVGLATARQLQRRGFDVTVHARALPPDTTSNMAYAGFSPLSNLVSAPERTPTFDAQFDRAVRVSYEQMQRLAGAGRGVSWLTTYTWTNRLSSRRAEDSGLDETESGLDPDVDVGATVLQPGEHPFPGTYALRRPTLRIEPSIYLDRLMEEFLLFGGRVRIRSFETPRDLMSLDEPLIANCTGLGSRALFGDETMTPIKGQLTFLAPQPGIDYSLEGSAPGGGRIGVLPRSDGIALGHVMERGDWSLEPIEEAIATRLDRAGRLMAAMADHPSGLGGFAAVPWSPALRDALRHDPVPATPPPVESFFDIES